MMKKVFVFLITAFIVSLFLSLMFVLGVAEIWNLKLSDNLFVEKEISDKIKIIAIDDKSLQEIGRWPWSRDKFAQILDKIDAKVIGVDLSFFETSDKDFVLEKALNENVVLIEEIVYPSGELLTPVFKHDNLGLANIFTDQDGVVREVPVVLDNHEGFSYKVIKNYLSDFSYDEATLRINYVGKPGKFERFSFSDVLEEGLQGEIILIGATSPDLHDNYLVPTSKGNNMPGVEVHANTINTFLTRNYLREQDNLYVIFLIFLFCFLVAFVMLFFSVFWASFIILGIIVIYYFYSFFMFDRGVIVNLIYPVFGVIFVYVVLVILYYLLEKRNRKKIENIFGKYISKNVMDHVLKMPDLHGEDREVTVLFADIRGFTKMSEKMTPREVVSMLNKYLGGMAEIVMKYDGTLDKYMGDCIMVFFNAPIKQDDHILRAMKCGIEMQEVIDNIKKDYKHKIGVGIGINFGEVIVGNMGSKNRLEYTVIGDTVNLTSRLCGLAEAGKILISEEVYLKIKDKVKVEKIGKFKVKGKEKEIVVYDVLKVLD